MDERNDNFGSGAGSQSGSGSTVPGAANTPTFGSGSTGSTGSNSTSETERRLAETRDMVAEAAAPIMAEKAQEAVGDTIDRLKGPMGDQMKDQVKRTAAAVGHDAERKVQDRANQVLDQAADTLGQAADRLNQFADQQGGSGARARAGEVAHRAADAMESTARYLRDNDAQRLQSDLEGMVKSNPLQTLLIGAAAGWIVGKILR